MVERLRRGMSVVRRDEPEDTGEAVTLAALGVIASGCGYSLERLGGVDDGDAVEVLEVQKMRIAGDDDVGVGRNGAGEDRIVVRVCDHGG